MRYVENDENMGKRIIITVIGPDRVGIIAGVTGILVRTTLIYWT